MKKILVMMAVVLASGAVALKAADTDATGSALKDLQDTLGVTTKGGPGGPGGHFGPGGDHGGPGGNHGGPGDHGGFNPNPPAPFNPGGHGDHGGPVPLPGPWHPQRGPPPGPLPDPWHPGPGPQPGPWHPQPGPHPDPWHPGPGPQPFPPNPYPPFPPNPYPPAPQPYPAYGVTVYQHSNFGGYAVLLEPGAYSLAALQMRGMRNDDISSVSVPYGYRVTFFADDNFMGMSWTETRDNYNFSDSGYNDIVTSIVVYGPGH